MDRGDRLPLDGYRRSKAPEETMPHEGPMSLDDLPPSRPLLGFSLHADADFLEIVRPIIDREAEYYEVAPEALWRPTGSGLEPNDYFRLFEELRRRSGRPFVAHGLAFSLGSDPDDIVEKRRFETWLEGLRFCHRSFQFEWFSDHLGFVYSGGRNAILPLPLPQTEEAADRVARRLRRISSVVPAVAFENPGGFFRPGPAGLDAAFWNRIIARSGGHLVLDLHNLHTESVNLDFDPLEVIEGLDLSTAIQIHLSGGSTTDPSWWKGQRPFRIDSHDGRIPDAVWNLFEEVLPRCPNLRGVLIERLNGSIEPDDAGDLGDEMQRARHLIESRRLNPRSTPPDRRILPPGGGLDALQERLVQRLPVPDSHAMRLHPPLPAAAAQALAGIDAEAWHLTGLILRKLRFEWLQLAAGDAREEFDDDPEAHMELHEAFAAECPLTAHHPIELARDWWNWKAARTVRQPKSRG